MVLQNKLEYGFDGGDKVHAMPHFPKSFKRKRSVRKKGDDYKMCAFDLLATVADQLLSERENSSVSQDCNNGAPKILVKHEWVSTKQSFKTEAFDQQSCNQTISDPKIVTKNHIPCGLTEHSQSSSPTDSGPASLVVKANTSDDAGGSVILNDGAKICYPSYGSLRKSPSFAKVQVEGDGLTRPLEPEHQMLGNGLELNAQDLYSLEDPIDLDTKPPALVSSDSSTEAPVCRNYLPSSSSMPKHASGMEQIVHRDDDDNFSGCTHPSIITNRTNDPQCLGDLGVRKVSASKYWKATPNMLKYDQVANYDIGKKPAIRGKKLFYTRQRTQRSYFKRKKLFERCSISVSNGGFFREGISNRCGKDRIKIEAHDQDATNLEVLGDVSTKMAHSSSYDSVRLSIKSFKVPELFVEIPDTATVGSLKRTVLEAVTAILQGGLRVGVILQGKKVRDDNKTLYQVGISRRDIVDSLGFMLEPSQTQNPPPLTRPADSQFLCVDDAVEPLARIPPIISRDLEASDAIAPPVQTYCLESDHDSVHSPTDALTLDKTNANKLALVALQPMSIEALEVVPLRKTRRPENVQRRIRRPFTVAEVEALVQAVEKLGTGRWRDVKLRAFDSAKHRTYVDLKDKWKTLVHTARISPQQRRGEPVPQELLDRVLSAQAYWSQQQAKLHIKPPPTCSSDSKQLSLPCLS